jgi:lysophospholipase L1-like esterase
MRDVITPMRPSVVLFLVGINDVERQDLADFDRTLLAESQTGWRRKLQALSDTSRIIAWGRNLLRALSAQARGLSHGSVDLQTLPTQDVPADQRARLLQRQAPFLQGYESRLRGLVRLSRESGIRPVLITQPALFGAGQDDVTQADLAAIRVDAERNGRTAWEILEKYNDITRNVAREQGLLVIDLARELRKSSDYFYDFYHFTNAGADAAGHLVYTHLKPTLRKAYPEFFHGK